MLKKRLLTAIILIPLFVLLLFKLTPYAFTIFTVCLVLYAAWEWSALMGIKPFLLRLCYPVVIYGVVSFPLFIPISYVLLLTIFWWLFALILVLRYPRTRQFWSKSLWVRGLMGMFVLLPAWRALNFIRDTDLYGSNDGVYALLFLFILIWGADSGAYFVGKKWGKQRLAPEVSPGKTLQGLIGALLTALIISPLYYYLLPTSNPPVFALMLLSIVTVLFSILGDLFESMLKRNAGLKDSGSLFPGHGGLLDRIDSLTAAAPIFALGSFLILKMFN